MLPLDTIYNEDCLQGMRRMGDGTVDCIVCDPPYLLENQGTQETRGERLKELSD